MKAWISSNGWKSIRRTHEKNPYGEWLWIFLSRCSNNLNQYARKANQTGNIFWADIQDLKERLNEIYDLTEKILIRLNALQR